LTALVSLFIWIAVIIVALFAVSFVMTVVAIIVKQNKSHGLHLTVSVTKADCEKKEAKVSTNVPYLIHLSEQFEKEGCNREFLKQMLRMDLLTMQICTCCVDDNYTFYANTWLFNEAELEELKKHGFEVNPLGIMRQLSAKFVTAVLAWRLQGDFKGVLKFWKKSRQFYEIRWTPASAYRLLNYITAV